MDKLDELKSIAGKRCISVFETFDGIEIQEQLAPVRSAWHIGRELSALISENKPKYKERRLKDMPPEFVST